MATFYLTEFANVVIHQGSGVPLACLPEGATQTKTLSGSSQSFTALAATTNYVCLHSDGICSWASGVGSATAATTANRRPADFVEYLFVPKGQGIVIACITNT